MSKQKQRYFGSLKWFDRMIEVGDCWLWTGHLDREGYGHALSTTVHRAVWETLIGPIPEGLTLDHLCRVRHCVNPDHLRPCTIKENNHSSPRYWATRPKPDNSATHCKHGHPYNKKNTYWYPGTNRRECRVCNLNSWRRKNGKEIIRGEQS